MSFRDPSKSPIRIQAAPGRRKDVKAQGFWGRLFRFQSEAPPVPKSASGKSLNVEQTRPAATPAVKKPNKPQESIQTQREREYKHFCDAQALENEPALLISKSRQVGRVVFTLNEIALNVQYNTEIDTPIERISATEVKLGGRSIPVLPMANDWGLQNAGVEDEHEIDQDELDSASSTTPSKTQEVDEFSPDKQQYLSERQKLADEANQLKIQLAKERELMLAREAEQLRAQIEKEKKKTSKPRRPVLSKEEEEIVQKERELLEKAEKVRMEIERRKAQERQDLEDQEKHKEAEAKVLHEQAEDKQRLERENREREEEHKRQVEEDRKKEEDRRREESERKQRDEVERRQREKKYQQELEERHRREQERERQRQALQLEKDEAERKTREAQSRREREQLQLENQSALEQERAVMRRELEATIRAELEQSIRQELISGTSRKEPGPTFQKFLPFRNTPSNARGVVTVRNPTVFFTSPRWASSDSQQKQLPAYQAISSSVLEPSLSSSPASTRRRQVSPERVRREPTPVGPSRLSTSGRASPEHSPHSYSPSTPSSDKFVGIPITPISHTPPSHTSETPVKALNFDEIDTSTRRSDETDVVVRSKSSSERSSTQGSPVQFNPNQESGSPAQTTLGDSDPVFFRTKTDEQPDHSAQAFTDPFAAFGTLPTPALPAHSNSFQTIPLDSPMRVGAGGTDPYNFENPFAHPFADIHSSAPSSPYQPPPATPLSPKNDFSYDPFE